MSCHGSFHHVMSCHALSRLIMSCHDTFHYIMSCHLLPHVIMLCHDTSHHITSCHVTSHLSSSCHPSSLCMMYHIYPCNSVSKCRPTGQLWNDLYHHWACLSCHVDPGNTRRGCFPQCVRFGATTSIAPTKSGDDSTPLTQLLVSDTTTHDTTYTTMSCHSISYHNIFIPIHHKLMGFPLWVSTYIQTHGCSP